MQHGHMNIKKKSSVCTLLTEPDVRHPIQLGCNPLYSTRWKTKDTLSKVMYIFPFTFIHVSTTQGTKELHRQCAWTGAYKHIENMLWTSSTYRVADKSVAWPTSQRTLFDGENISFDASLFIYINSTNIPPIMIINRIYENQNLLSL